MDQYTSAQSAKAETAHSSYEAPAFRVIALDCEITAYAPDDGDAPLF